MASFFKKLFGGGTTTGAPTSTEQPAQEKREYQFLNWHTVSSDELSQWPDGIYDIYHRKIDGFLVKNVLSPAEVQTVMDRWNSFPVEKKHRIVTGLIMYPLAFSQVDQSSESSREKMKDYFRNCVAFHQTLAEEFGVDFAGRLREVLGRISGGREIRIPVGADGVGNYTLGNFRELEPGEGELKAHCGNFFHDEFPQFFANLEEHASVKDQMSYFFMLQTAEQGGELCIFDIEWVDTKVRLPGAKVLKKEDGSLLDLEDWTQVKRQMMRPQPGDMIIFAGGQIWHRVEYVKGSRSRLTFGGFISVGHDGQSIYHWT